MHGSFFSGPGTPEHRLTDDDMHNIRRCLNALKKIKLMADNTQAEGASWQLEQLIAGLSGILRAGKVLTIK
ncbi:MAG TPA: hypothetical protein PLN21_05490 [Gemmatales bacterium]|nr:hypothetical protein [Gemmatales bacterium]